MTQGAVSVRAGNRRVSVGNAEKVLFADPGVTKRELAAYYRDVASVLLPHLRGHPVAMERFPDGVDAGGFMQKQVPSSAPEWLHRVDVPRERGGSVTMPVCRSAADLVWAADQAAVTFHALTTRSDDLRTPDRIVFDLDPSGPDFAVVRRAALATRELLDELGLPAFPMTTGSRGLHVTVPLRRRDDVDDVRDFARQVAEALVDRYPDELTVEARKNRRGGRLYVDVMRNAYAQHAVTPYTVRPQPGAPVATPLSWDEVDDPELTPRRWGLRDIAERLADRGDPWQGMGRHAHTLGPARPRLDEERSDEQP